MEVSTQGLSGDAAEVVRLRARCGVYEVKASDEWARAERAERQLQGAVDALRGMVDLYRHPDSGRVLVEPGASDADDALIAALAFLDRERSDDSRTPPRQRLSMNEED